MSTPLDNITYDVRKSMIRMFTVYLSLSDARIIESYCHTNRCTVGTFAGIRCWRYGAVTLFETDKLETHQHMSAFSYSNNILRIYNLLKRKVPFKEVKDLWYMAYEDPKYTAFQDRYRENIHEAQKVLTEKVSSGKGLFTCARCKSVDIDTEQKQTRAADEPMTVFCACTRCGLRWTIK